VLLFLGTLVGDTGLAHGGGGLAFFLAVLSKTGSSAEGSAGFAGGCALESGSANACKKSRSPANKASIAAHCLQI
jgi:hypothetical protein